MRTILLVILLLIATRPSKGLAAIKHNELTLLDRKADLEVSQKSLDGTYFLTVSEIKGPVFRPPMKSSLLAIGTDGRVAFERSFEHRYRVMWAVDFKPIGQGLYGYFLCFEQPVNCGEASYHFLDADFHDVFPFPVPNQDKEFDSHDTIRAPNGNTFFMFLRQNLKNASVRAEIQEWTPRGEVLFSWRVQDHLQVKEDPVLLDNIHVNSMDRDSDGGLILGLLTPSKVIKIAYPSGKLEWEFSARDWTFVNDPLHGFRFQHAARRLKNGNILLFDNGDSGGRKTRAVEYRLDFANKKAELVWEYRCPDAETPYRMIGGSVQRLSNGNTLIGWGAPDYRTVKPGTPMTLFTEVSPDRQVVRELKSTASQVTYHVWFQENGSH